MAALFDAAEDGVRRRRRGRARRRRHDAGPAGRHSTWTRWTACTAPTSAARSSSTSRPRAGCADGGAIINFSSSVTGAGPAPATAPTPPPRARSRRMTLILARELRGRDITVNAVAPGPTATELFLRRQGRGDRSRSMAGQPPLERLGTPEDIAEVVAFLAGPAPLGQRPGPPRQRRHRLTAAAHSRLPPHRQAEDYVMSKTILITGAPAASARSAARALARAGHTVYAGDARHRRAQRAPASPRPRAYAAEHGVDLRTVELDVQLPGVGRRRRGHRPRRAGRLDVLVHNAGHMVIGPAEAFTPEQLARALRHQRARHPARQPRRAARTCAPRATAWWSGSVSSSTRGGTPPYLAPYFAAKAAMDALAVSYAAELARFGIETRSSCRARSPRGTNHFATRRPPRRRAVVADVRGALRRAHGRRSPSGWPPSPPPDADVAAGRRRDRRRVVDTPPATAPSACTSTPRTTAPKWSATVADRIRAEFLARIGLADLLGPSARRARRAPVRSSATPA